jgi:hypothetical protein
VEHNPGGRGHEVQAGNHGDGASDGKASKHIATDGPSLGRLFAFNHEETARFFWTAHTSKSGKSSTGYGEAERSIRRLQYIRRLLLRHHACQATLNVTTVDQAARSFD